MKKLITAAVLTLSMTGIAAADVAKQPTMMTDTQMDNVVAGSLVEYALLASFMSLLGVNSVTEKGGGLNDFYGDIDGQIPTP